MPGIEDSPVGVLDRAGVNYRVVAHRPIRHQRDIEEHLTLPVERSVKTLVFQVADEQVILAVIPGPSRLNYRNLAEAVGLRRAQLRAAEPHVLTVLGMEPGGASPLCDRADVTTVFDSAVVDMGMVYCGSGHADRTLEVASGDLVRLARKAVVASITQ
jgi:Cys-tRNA(Pro)/Cys-tRNA(Cys) deacylase